VVSGAVPAPIFRKGLDLKHDVADALARDYHSQLIDQVKEAGYRWQVGRLTIHLAQEFGFCYGVDRAVDYAYQTRKRFPDRRVFLTGEIIHNPHVNTRLREADIHFLTDAGESVDDLGSDDVVILPAFGVTVGELEQLDRRGCTLVDTTCGSVLNVWKNVRQYTRDGYTAVIHGKVHHEETRATASQALGADKGAYLVILDREQASAVCDFIRGRVSRERFDEAFADACSPGFDPDRDLERVGLANQTTMLMSESLEIGDMIRHAMIDRYGVETLGEHYRAFETICSATQDRQDAIQTLLNTERLDLALVIGGYNSSNTRNLARICAERVPTYHIADPSCLVSPTEVRHRPASSPLPAASTTTAGQITAPDWLPAGAVTIAVTAGASTPDNVVGQVIERLIAFTDA
jgi:4-hydroxy-3-methylbut-2-en-1-yl diphosphate reductase